MKICIDVSPIIYETGVSSYTKNLVESLLQIDKNNNYVLFGGSLRRYYDLNNRVGNFKGKFEKKVFPIPPFLLDYLWNVKHIVPIEKLTGKINVFHSSDWTQPPTRAFKITTIHDLVPIRFPKISHPKIVNVHKRRLDWVKKEVDKIIAVSEFTKKEIIDLLGINPDKIVVIHEAPDSSLKASSKTEIQDVLLKYKIDCDYLLVVGADPRKNIDTVIHAFRKIKSHTNLKLIIIGRLWGKIKTSDSVFILGHVPRKDLDSLYTGATALVYTSSYEGFGLPILEAMKVGCPVVTSNLGSMKEVAGDGAVLVDPQDINSISRGIEKALDDRVRWINRGRKRVRQFSWVDSAKETLKVYEGLIK